MLTQTLLWVAFNAFWASLASLLAQSWGLGPFWAGAFGLVGVAGALAANAGGRAADRMGPLKVLAFSIVCVALGYVALALAGVSLAALVVGVVLLDLGCQSALVSNQTRIFALDPTAQGRLNTLFMVSIFLGGAGGAGVERRADGACRLERRGGGGAARGARRRPRPRARASVERGLGEILTAARRASAAATIL